MKARLTGFFQLSHVFAEKQTPPVASEKRKIVLFLVIPSTPNDNLSNAFKWIKWPSRRSTPLHSCPVPPSSIQCSTSFYPTSPSALLTAYHSGYGRKGAGLSFSLPLSLYAVFTISAANRILVVTLCRLVNRG